MPARGAPPRASVPGRVRGPVLARLVPARSVRAVAVPCGRRAMRVRRAGSGGCADPAYPRCSWRRPGTLRPRYLAEGLLATRLSGSGRDSAPAGAPCWWRERSGRGGAGGSRAGRAVARSRCWSLGRGRGSAGAAGGPSPPMPRARSTGMLCYLGVGYPLRPLS